jgi:hypothetical protein
LKAAPSRSRCNGSEKPARPSRVAELERINAELQQELHKIQKRKGGSLFDFWDDTVDNIATTMFRTSKSRATGIARRIMALEKAEKALEKAEKSPAG